MERHETSVVRTPSSSVVVQSTVRQKSHCYSTGAASRIGLTSTLTARRLNTSRKAPKSHDITERVDPGHLALLVKHKWQLSCLTPLYQFKHTEFKSYSKQLAAFIAAERQKDLVVEGTQNNLKVSFSVVQGLAETDEDPETVLIQIYSKSLFARQDEMLKTVWSGWLTCINGDQEYLHSFPSDFTCLPLFGSSGTEVLTSLVKYWFELTFDCCFGPLQINHTSLEWLMALWTNCHAESNIQHLKMVWNIPAVPPLQVTFTIDAQDAWELWRSIRRAFPERTEEEKGEEEESWIDIEEVINFMHGLKSHFYRHFRLDLSAGNLSLVSTALGSASSNGRIKISNSKYMITTLAFLTELSFLKMPL